MNFPIPGDWDGESWCKWAVCWPDSELWRGFLRGLLSLPARGWTWDASTGDLMAAIETGKEIRAANLPLVGSLMSCNDENLAGAFTDIAAAIRMLAARSSANGCCDTPEIVIQNSIQNFVVQPVGGNPIPVYGSEPTLGLGPGEFPPEFETEEEFNLAKCQVAHMIVDRFIKTLRDLGSISNFDFNVLGAAVVGIIAFNLAFPPALIPTLIGAMIILAASGYYLPQVADYVQDNRDEWICMLYEGESTELIIGAIADAADIAVAFVTAPTGLGAAIKLIIMVVLNADNVNELFRGLAASGYPDAECDCGDWWSCVVGDILESDSSTITLSSILAVDGMYAAAIGYPDEHDLVELSADLSDWTPPTVVPEFASAWDSRVAFCGLGWAPEWENMSSGGETGPVAARTLEHRSESPFLVVYTRIVP